MVYGTYRLEENYTMIPGSCLARSVIYTHYQDFCKKNHLVPHSAASFGKVRYQSKKFFIKIYTRNLFALIKICMSSYERDRLELIFTTCSVLKYMLVCRALQRLVPYFNC